MEEVSGSFYALIGRPERSVAAACSEADMNRLGLHICCVGNYDEAPPKLTLLECLARRVLLPWMDEYGIAPAQVIGHREAGLIVGLDYRKVGPDGRRQYKTCPGLLWDMDLVRRMVT